MNGFNRVVMILLILALLIALPVCVLTFLIYPTDAFTFIKAQVTVIQDQFTQVVYWVTSLVGGVLCGLIEVFLVLLLVGETIWSRRKKAIQVPMVEGGEARLHVDSIIQRLRYEVERLPDITTVKPRVQSKGNKGVNVVLAVETAPTVDIPSKTTELVALVRDQVENRMGIRVNKVTVNLKHSPYAAVTPQRLR